MSGHTKGPWHQDKYGSVRGADGESIAFRGVSTLCSGSDESIAEAEANTTLACAAPDLLEALERLATTDISGADDYVVRFIMASLQHNACAAIAKARGEK